MFIIKMTIGELGSIIIKSISLVVAVFAVGVPMLHLFIKIMF